MPSDTSVGICARLFIQSATSVLLFWLFIPSTTLVVMCSGLLCLVQPWVLCVLDFYAKYNLGCYVFSTFIPTTTMVVVVVV